MRLDVDEQIGQVVGVKVDLGELDLYILLPLGGDKIGCSRDAPAKAIGTDVPGSSVAARNVTSAATDRSPLGRRRGPRRHDRR